MRRFSSLAPKPTSKKTLSRYMIKEGMPHPSSGLLPPKDRTLSFMGNMKRNKKLINNLPSYNHNLVANKEVSRRERHFRRILAMAQCAGEPYLPDLTTLVPPPWISQEGFMGMLDPTLQSTYNTRLVKAYAASKDEQTKKQLLHAQIISQKDLDQIQELTERGNNLAKQCLFDRVYVQAEQQMLDNMSQILDGQVDAYLPQLQNADEPLLENVQKKQAVLKVVPLEGKTLPPTATQKQVKQFIKNKILEAFQQHPTDFGSVRVQAALLTLRIRSLCVHLYKDHQQDTSARVLVDILCQQRRRQMDSLRRQDIVAYMTLVNDLGLKVS